MSVRNLSTSFLVLTLILTGIAFSQDSGLEEVTVTAQRQEQSLQDIPLAVSALSEDDLFDQQIEGPGDLQLTVPSLRFGSDHSPVVVVLKLGVLPTLLFCDCRCWCSYAR